MALIFSSSTAVDTPSSESNLVQRASFWTGGPFSVSMWINRVSSSGQRFGFTMGTDDSGDYQAYMSVAATTLYTGATARTTSTGSTAASGTAGSTGTWINHIVMFDATGYTITKRYAVYAGDLANRATSGTVSQDISNGGLNTPNLLRLCQVMSGTLTGPNLKVAHMGWWDRVLTDGEITSLQTYVPSYISSGLVSYWPLVSGVTDDYGSNDFTAYSVSYDSSEPTLSAGSSVPVGFFRPNQFTAFGSAIR